MNSDTVIKQEIDITGQIKEVVGKAFGNQQLPRSGVSYQISSSLQIAYSKSRDFACEQPSATAPLGGVLGSALFSTLRGK